MTTETLKLYVLSRPRLERPGILAGSGVESAETVSVLVRETRPRRSKEKSDSM